MVPERKLKHAAIGRALVFASPRFPCLTALHHPAADSTWRARSTIAEGASSRRPLPGLDMKSMLKSLLKLAIAVTERALRTEARPRCIRGASMAARAARGRQLGHPLAPSQPGSAAPVGAAKS